MWVSNVSILPPTATSNAGITYKYSWKCRQHHYGVWYCNTTDSPLWPLIGWARSRDVITCFWLVSSQNTRGYCNTRSGWGYGDSLYLRRIVAFLHVLDMHFKCYVLQATWNTGASLVSFMITTPASVRQGLICKIQKTFNIKRRRPPVSLGPHRSLMLERYFQ